MKEYRGLYAKVILVSIPSIAGGAAMPLLVSRIVDSVTSGKTENLFAYMIYFALLLIITKTGDFIFNYHFSTAGRIVAAAERKKLANKFLFSKSNLCSFYSEEKLVNRIINEVYALGTLYGTAPVMLILNMIMGTVAFAVLAFLNFKLLILSCSAIPLVYICGILLKNKIAAASKEESLSYEKLFRGAAEVIRGFPDIKILKAENEMLNKINSLNKSFLGKEKKQLFIERLYSDVLNILFSALPLVCLLAGFYLSSKNNSSLGSAISFYIYVSYFIEPINNLTNLRMMVLGAKQKAKLIKELEDEFEQKLTGSGDFERTGEIFLERIYHNYGKVEINSDLNIKINKPGIYGISAVSGAGKSTALKILSGLLFSPDSLISISGKNVKNIDCGFLNESVCYVSDKSFIFEGSVKENIELSAKLKLNNDALNFLFEKDENINAETILESEGKNISLGQKQRIIMLRLFSLIEKPPVIILDEALSGTDENREVFILKTLKTHFPDSKILFVTHRTSSFNLCDFKLEF